MPEMIGRRLGFFFLYHSCVSAWSHPISRLLINTCTLDNPRALPLYQRLGFVPYARKSGSWNCPDPGMRAMSQV
jgi:hypothetical protein